MNTEGGTLVVVGVDGSLAADRALMWAAQAATDRGVAVEVVHAWMLSWFGSVPDLLTLEPVPYEQAAQALLDEAIDRARERGLTVELRPRLVQLPAAAALLAAAESAALLVVGSHGRGRWGHRVLGSVSQQCAAHASQPVVVVPDEWGGRRRGRIVVGVDGSEPSYAALHFAAREAGRCGAELDVVHAWPQPELSGIMPGSISAEHTHFEKASDELLAQMTHAIQRGSPIRPGPASLESISVEGDPARCLVSIADGADLLVVGSRGHGGFAGLLLGSVSQRCLHHASCPVAVTHA